MKYRYEATVTGHEPPFKWGIFRRKAGMTSASEVSCGSGTSDSYEEALFDAAAKAREVEWERYHSNTKRKVVLFDVDEDDYPPLLEGETDLVLD